MNTVLADKTGNGVMIVKHFRTTGYYICNVHITYIKCMKAELIIKVVIMLKW